MENEISESELFDKPYQCRICLKSFATLIGLEMHVKTHTSGKKKSKPSTACVNCGEEFTQMNELLNHMAVHKDEPSLDRKRRDRNIQNLLKSHLAFQSKKSTANGPSASVENDSVSANVSANVTPSQSDITLSQSDVTDAAESVFLCAICCISFHEKATLDIHMKSHQAERARGKKVYKCDICLQTFASKSGLTRHAKMHIITNPTSVDTPANVSKQKTPERRKDSPRESTVAKLHNCTICGLDFPEKELLENHFSQIHGSKTPRKSRNSRTTKVVETEKAENTYTKGQPSPSQGKSPSEDVPSGISPTFECTICEEGFEGPKQTISHMVSHDVVGKFKCLQCSKYFKSPSQVKVHYAWHAGEKLFQCATCQKSYADKWRLQRHLKTHSGVKPFACHICDKRFTYSHYLKTHLASHSVDRPHNCVVCGSSFKTMTSLCTHMKTHTKTHTNTLTNTDTKEKKFKCEICEKVFHHATNLGRHKRVHGKGNKNCVCYHCGKAFYDNTRLNVHMRIHAKVKPFPCALCDKQFASRQELTSHSYLHTGKKPHKCEECGRKFRHRNSYQTHLRTHTGDKPYQCDVCQKSFRDRSNLAIHMRIHNNDRRHQCETCGKVFLQIGVLKTHILRRICSSKVPTPAVKVKKLVKKKKIRK